METKIPDEIRERIIGAADRLYDESGREKHPSVDAVRRLARADMNTTSLVVKEWKRQQTEKPAPVPVAVPDQVQRAGAEALATVWAVAHELSNTSLTEAESKWAVERAAQEIMRLDLSLSFDAQTIEIEDLKAALLDANRHAADAMDINQALRAEIESLQIALAASKAETVLEEARAVEIEVRATDLKAELERSHAETEVVRGELSAARLSHLAEKKQLEAVAAQELETSRQTLEASRVEVATLHAKIEATETAQQDLRQSQAQEANRQAERFIKLQTERDCAVSGMAVAREVAAKAEGQIEALTTQAKELMALMAPRKEGE